MEFRKFISADAFQFIFKTDKQEKASDKENIPTERFVAQLCTFVLILCFVNFVDEKFIHLGGSYSRDYLQKVFLATLLNTKNMKKRYKRCPVVEIVLSNEYQVINFIHLHSLY